MEKFSVRSNFQSLTGKEEVSKRLVGKKACLSASDVVDLCRDRCERVRVSRESRTRGKLRMNRVIAERKLNAAAEL